MENEGVTAKKNTIRLPYNDTSLEMSGDFDSGNLNSACVSLNTNELQLSFGKDKEIKPSSKTWFYFSIRSEDSIEMLKLCLLRVNTISVAAKVFDFYRPVIKEEGKEWCRLENSVEFENSAQGDVNMRFTINLQARKTVFIALTYPWSFEENENFLQGLQKKLRKRQDIYFNKQTLVLSHQQRPLHLLAITSPDCLAYPPEKYLEHLFPNRQIQTHFREVHKPLILVSSRVHPGEVGSSHALNGMLQFLVSNQEEAVKLRKQFYFLIIPMLNPDGVFNGNNRMDSLGQNLNRFYHLPDYTLQPSCYALKSLLQLTRRQIFAFFDLHGHANKKSCFLFGNSISNARIQTESVLFAKHLSTICEHMQFKTCNFSKKQMSSRDKNEDLSKEGCARVVVHRWTNSPYCYTLETGLFKDVRTDEKGILRFGDKFYDIPLYKDLGRKMLISFGTILKNDKSLDQMRRFCAEYVARMDKPKKQKAVVPKSLKSLKIFKNIAEVEPELLKIASERKQESSESNGRESRARQISGVLRKNKGVLLGLNEDDDDQ